MPNVRSIPNCPKACSSCRTRKVKCDGCRPCSNCRNHEKECFYPLSQRGKRNRTRGRNPLEERLSRVESFMQMASFENAQASVMIPTETINYQSPSQIGDEILQTSQSLVQTQQSPRSAFPDLPKVGDEPPTARFPPRLGPPLDTTTPAPPMHTPQSWGALSETVSSNFVLDGRSLSEADQEPVSHREENELPTQTRIWEHHGEFSPVCAHSQL